MTDDLVSRLLDQNAALIEALSAAVRSSNPVAIIQAMNPPWTPPEANQTPHSQDLWADDPEPVQSGRRDPWGDDKIPDERLIPGRGGWVSVNDDNISPEIQGDQPLSTEDIDGNQPAA